MEMNEKFSNAQIDEINMKAARDLGKKLLDKTKGLGQKALDKTAGARAKTKSALDKTADFMNTPKGAAITAGTGAFALRGKMDRVHYKKKLAKMQNESLGLKLLEKLDRMIKENDSENQDKEFDVVDKNQGPEDKVETSETLKKLKGHLYRFQEAEGDGKAFAGGALAGAVGGRQLARHIAGEQSGANQAIKNVKAGMAKSVKRQARFDRKALQMQDKAKVARAIGDMTKANALDTSASKIAQASKEAGKVVKAGNKQIKALQATKNAAGKIGGWKGAATIGLASLAAKKIHDNIRK
ncbi:MAG: hypothetical protein IJH34_02470 [Romboutsia sp.]|nr:hypothetical protein [Romboutsia sp.]